MTEEKSGAESGDPHAPPAGFVPGGKIVVVEDDPAFQQLLRYHLERAGWEPVLVGRGDEAPAKVREVSPRVVLCDIMLPGKNGREILEEIGAAFPELPVVMMTASGSIETAVECMKRGAYDYLVKPFEFERLQVVLRNATQYRELRTRVRTLETQLTQKHGFDKIIAFSPGMRAAVEQARRASAGDVDVLILGESGSGKEVLARAVHFNSPRRTGPFVAVNCGAIPEGLLESELFGHERGAFTGASTQRTGCFEQAHTGTLFLDEIAEMRPEMQVRLLRALENREIRRVGGDHTFKVNVRVISATNQDIQARLKNGRFRADLYYRLAIMVLTLPPLRERREDIGPLAQHFLKELVADGHARAAAWAPEALAALLGYDWPGNARELRNAVERAAVFEDSGAVTLNSLPPELAALGRPAAATGAAGAASAATDIQAAPPLPATMGANEPAEILPMEEEEKRIILRALAVTGGNVSEAARRLNLHRSTLHRKMARFGLAIPDEAGGADDPASAEPADGPVAPNPAKNGEAKPKTFRANA